MNPAMNREKCVSRDEMDAMDSWKTAIDGFLRGDSFL
jgi:hypothetical protein